MLLTLVILCRYILNSDQHGFSSDNILYTVTCACIYYFTIFIDMDVRKGNTSYTCGVFIVCYVFTQSLLIWILERRILLIPMVSLLCGIYLHNLDCYGY